MPNNEIVPFAFEDASIRTLLVEGKPWFVANDITSALGYKNGRDAVSKHTSDSQRRVSRIATPSGEQSATILSEGGVWRLIMRSNIPNAIAFQDWLADTVIPTLMRTGSYTVQRELTENEIVLQALTYLKDKSEAQEETIKVLAPKASAWDAIVSSAGSWSYQDAAHALYEQKSIVIGQKRLVALLVDWAWAYRDHKGRPHAYQRILEQGLLTEKIRTYVDTVTGETLQSSAPQVRITGKGLDVIYQRLSEAVSA